MGVSELSNQLKYLPFKSKSVIDGHLEAFMTRIKRAWSVTGLVAELRLRVNASKCFVPAYESYPTSFVFLDFTCSHMPQRSFVSIGNRNVAMEFIYLEYLYPANDQTKNLSG